MRDVRPVGATRSTTSVPRGAIAAPDPRARSSALPPARQIKLYNAGSFFDPQAIPRRRLRADRVGRRGIRSRDRRIASGVSARPVRRCVPAVSRSGGRPRSRWPSGSRPRIGMRWRRLNKRMTLDDFADAAAFLAQHAIALRVFVLLDPPFVPHHDGAEWALSSVRTARGVGASVCVGDPDARRQRRHRRAAGRAAAAARSRAISSGWCRKVWPMRQGRMRVFADLWDVEQLFDCRCSTERAGRLAQDESRAGGAAAGGVCLHGRLISPSSAPDSAARFWRWSRGGSGCASRCSSAAGTRDSPSASRRRRWPASSSSSSPIATTCRG